MSENKIRYKVGSLLIMGLIILGGFSIIISNVAADSSWLENSDTDFNNGTLINIKINGSGSAAELIINETFSSGWTNKMPITNPGGRCSTGLASIYGTDKVIMFGGWDTTGWATNETWIYNLSFNKWTKKNILVQPSSRFDHEIASIWGTDKVLLFGGHDNNMGSKFNDTWIYDLSDNTWAYKITSIKPSARYYSPLATIYGYDKVLMFGGSDGSTYLNDTWIYDLSINNWTKKMPKNYPTGMIHPCGLASIYGTDKVLYFYGDNLNSSKSETWIYDLSENNWTKKSPKNSPFGNNTYAISSVYGTDKVVIFGGDMFDNQTWIYDLSEDNWTELKLMISPAAKYDPSISSIHGMDKIILFGGQGGANWNETWILDINQSVNYGYYISKPFDTGTNSAFKSLIWNGNTSINTSIRFRLKTATTKSALNGMLFIGPGGSSSNFYIISPATLWTGHHGDRWVQYKAYLNTNSNETPSLKNVTLKYNNLPTTQLTNPSNWEIITNNTPIFKWNFNDSDSTSQSAFQLQIDDDPAFLSIDYDSGTQDSMNQSWQFPNGTSYSSIPNGTWYWKARTKDSDGDWGIYSSTSVVIIGVGCPNTTITIPQNNSVLQSLNEIHGTTEYNNTTQKILKVEICIKRLSDDKYWNGSGWNLIKKWLLALGNTTWNYNSTLVIWTSGNQYLVQSRAADNRSNIETPNYGNKFTIDTTKPNSTINVPVNNSVVNNLNIISGSAYDLGGAGVRYVEISIKRLRDSFYWTGNFWSSAIYWLRVNGKSAWNYNTTNLSWDNGTQYLARSRATDYANNIENPSDGNLFSFNTSIKPSSRVDGPTNNSVIYNLLLISGRAWTSNMYTKISKVEITIKRLSDDKYWDGTNWILTKTWLNTSGTINWNYKWNWTLNPGKYHIQSMATDNQSNVEDPKYGVIFTLKVRIYSNINVPADNSTLSSLNKISGTAWVTYNNSNITKVHIYIKRLSDDKFWDGLSWISSVTWLLTTGTNSWFYNSSSVTWTNNTQYMVRSRATDEFANVEYYCPLNRFTIKFSSPIKGPSSTITVPANNTILNKLTMISGTASVVDNSSKISKVELIIERLSDNRYWTGVSWNTSQIWLLATGTNSWSYSTALVSWASGNLYIIRSRATDNRKNVESPGFGNLFLIDLIKPTSKVMSPTNNTSVKVLNIIYGSASDTGGSGVTHVKINIRRFSDLYSWSGSNWVKTETWLSTFGITNWTYYSGSIPWKSGARYNIRSKATDNANNDEMPNSGVIFTFVSNITKPTSTITSPKHNSYLNSLNTILGTAAAAVNLSISKVEISIRRWTDYYYWNGTAWSPVEHWLPAIGSTSWSYTLTKLIWSNGKSYNIRSRATDSLNGVEIPSSGINFWFDNKPPRSLKISINSDSQYTNNRYVRLDLYANDPESGISQMSFSFNGINWTSWEEFKSVAYLNLTSNDGERKIYFRVKDRAKNVATANDTIIMDTTPPHSLSILINNGANVTNTTNVTLNLSALDKGSGVYQMSFSNDGKTWTAWEDFSIVKQYNLTSGVGLKTVYLRVKDKINNIAKPVSDTIFLNTSSSSGSSSLIFDEDNDGVLDIIDAFSDDPAASVDLDRDGYPDYWNPGKSKKDSTTGLYLDAFPDDSSASVDSDSDGYPDFWNEGKSEENSTTSLHLDAFPFDRAASLDSDSDYYPDSWNSGMTLEDSTTDLILDAYPDDPERWIEEDQSRKKPILNILPVIILVIIIIVVIILAKMTSIIVKKHHRLDKQEDDSLNEGKVLEKIKYDIIHGKTMDYMQLSKTELEDLLDRLYQEGEVSEETLAYLGNLISDYDKIIKHKKDDF